MKRNSLNIPEPVVKQEIYVPTSLYLSHGEDDFVGGLAIISKVQKNEKFGKEHPNYILVEVEEDPGTLYNWTWLLEKQESLKREFGNKRAFKDPDYRPEFNRWF